MSSIRDEQEQGGVVLRSREESLQYGGELFSVASQFLRRVPPLKPTGQRPSGVSTLAGLRATATLLTSLPRLHVWVSDSPAGQRLRRHFTHRIWGIPHTRLAQGVLVLPEEKGRYLRGRSRQAVRTNIRKAREAGIVCRSLSDIGDRRATSVSLRPGASESTDERYALPGDQWHAAFAPGGAPLAIAQMTVDRECALLQTLFSSDHASRYLLHTELVETLVRAQVRYLAVHTQIAPLLEPGLQYWQRLLGYQVAHLSISRAPLPSEHPKLALDVQTGDAMAALLR
jgi:hypothetical protein